MPARDADLTAMKIQRSKFLRRNGKEEVSGPDLKFER